MPHTGTSIPDVHDTDHTGLNDIPYARDHQDVDILAYKFTHDANNLYAYFKADGKIGRTASTATQHGRYYVKVTIDMDALDLTDTTGYWLHDGGYYPTSRGYDMNMEVEYYDDAFNTAHYINHGAQNNTQQNQAFIDQSVGVVDLLPGSYDYPTQWVYHDDDMLTFVEAKGPVVHGIMTVAISPDGRQLEMKAPFKGFLNAKGDGTPIMALGKTIDISFSLEASGELTPAGSWASDTGDPINGYFLDTYPADFDFDGDVDGVDLTDPVDGWESRFGVDLDGGNFLDWQRQLGSGVLPLSAATTIPEPTSAFLLIGLTAIWLVARREVCGNRQRQRERALTRGQQLIYHPTL